MNMRKVFYAGLIALASLGAGVSHSSAAQAGEARDFGLGAIVGVPTGLTAKYWMTRATAIDGAIAWHFGDDDRLQLHADYLYHMDLHVNLPDGRLPFYIGPGLRVLAGDHSEAGLRIPIGISYMPTQMPIEVFGEIVPVVDFAPDTEADVEGGVGIRFYFK